MTEADWKDIKFFKPTENWGDASRMDKRLLLALDRFRECIHEPVYVTCGTQGVHSEKSFHYTGQAVDIILPTIKLEDLFDYFLEATRFDEFGGLGVYSQWSFMGKTTGGLHLDIRPTDKRSHWIGCKLSGKDVYLPLMKSNLKIAGLI